MVVFFMVFSCMQQIIQKEQRGLCAAYRIEMEQGVEKGWERGLKVRDEKGCEGWGVEGLL
jgi:flagellar biosynthesis/type III secretory pathway protein FliH